MPSFPIDYEFEVVCEVCGNGLCSSCTTGTQRSKFHPILKLPPCDRCIRKLQDEIDDLKDRIDLLEK